jgi:hypothetical protein
MCIPFHGEKNMGRSVGKKYEFMNSAFYEPTIYEVMSHLP